MLSREKLLLMFEMCLDGEEHCRARAAAARANGDHEAIAHEMRLEEQYGTMKKRVYDAIRRNGAGGRELPKVLLALRDAAEPGTPARNV